MDLLRDFGLGMQAPIPLAFNGSRMRQRFDRIVDWADNLAPGLLCPDQLGAIICQGEGALELVKARWGMPSPPGFLKTRRDPGVINVRNLTSRRWRRWLDREHRCLVPVTSFAEP